MEVVNQGYEAKDLDIAPRLYLSQGVKDVVIVDPHTPLVLHLGKEGAWRHVSPGELQLLCGFTLTV